MQTPEQSPIRLLRLLRPGGLGISITLGGWTSQERNVMEPSAIDSLFTPADGGKTPQAIPAIRERDRRPVGQPPREMQSG